MPNGGPPTVAFLTGLVGGLGAISVAGASAQSPSSADQLPNLTIESNLPADGFISRHAAVELRVNGGLEPGARLAVFLGTTDATDLFRPIPGGLRYLPRVVALPAGERELTVFLVRASGEWQELQRFPLRVRSAAGWDRGRFAPGLDLGLEGQLAQGQEPDQPAPPRDRYQDLTGQLAIENGIERGAVNWTTQAAVIGVSHRESALRFGQLSQEAPRVDLSSYLVRLGIGPSDLSLGQVSVGNQRHLISGFTSRGAALTLNPGARVELRTGIVNGSSIVGWSNPFGLNDADHRVLSGSVGVEVLPRPGALRVEVSGLTGSVRPLAGFNQGVVNDAEESRGFGVRLTVSDPSQRLRLEAGFARSAFDNPDDSTLSQGGDLVPVEEVVRNAHYLDATLDLLREVRLGGARTASFEVGFRRERVDPLYRSLGAFAQADRESNQVEARATVAALALQASHARSGDNLADLPSVLTSRTRRSGLIAEAPLPALLGLRTNWLPSLSLGMDRTRQFGEAVPENGDFAESHVPDQMSREHTASATWQLPRVSFAYRLSNVLQDNRQAGRESADISTEVHSFALGLNPVGSVSVDLGLDLERSENRELDQEDRTIRHRARATWSPFGQSSLSVSVSRTRSEDDADTRRRSDAVLDAQWSSLVPGLRPLGGRYYLRFSRTTGRNVDPQFGLDQASERWSLSSGLNLGIAPFRP
jgi:hypothetical protein